jgi:hypothetical protein
MSGIFRSHGIHGGPAGGEGVVHACAEVKEAQVSETEALLLLGGVTPAVAEVVIGERLRSGLRSGGIGDEEEHGLMVADESVCLFFNEGNGSELIVLVPDFPHVIRLRVFGILFEEILNIHD